MIDSYDDPYWSLCDSSITQRGNARPLSEAAGSHSRDKVKDHTFFSLPFEFDEILMITEFIKSDCNFSKISPLKQEFRYSCVLVGGKTLGL